MTLESSITQLNDSVQTLITLISGLDAVKTKPKAVKAVKAAPVKQAKPTIPVELDGAAAVATDSTCLAIPADAPTLEEVIDEMRVITDREVLSKIMKSFSVVRASDISDDKRTAFIEALHMELQKGAA